MQPPQHHLTPKHEAVHYIETIASSHYTKLRRLRPEIQREVQEELGAQVASGVCLISKLQKMVSVNHSDFFLRNSRTPTGYRLRNW